MTKEKFIPIDDETADRIVICSLKEAVETLDEHIALLEKNKNNLEEYEKDDLAEAILDRVALKRAYNYYGGDDV